MGEINKKTTKERFSAKNGLLLVWLLSSNDILIWGTHFQKIYKMQSKVFYSGSERKPIIKHIIKIIKTRKYFFLVIRHVSTLLLKIEIYSLLYTYKYPGKHYFFSFEKYYTTKVLGGKNRIRTIK